MSAHRTAIVVGGASGIGWATARALAADGCRVVIADRNADGARVCAAELGDPHAAAAVDVTDEGSVRQLFADTGGVDGVVNCARAHLKRYPDVLSHVMKLAAAQ
jgi:3-oxoacyl-[acyl-carrier protein] reductase